LTILAIFLADHKILWLAVYLFTVSNSGLHLTTWCYASVVYACLSLCHKSEFYQNG